jgi:signal peptidase I
MKNILMKGFIRELLITVGLAVAIFFILQTTIQSSIVEGSSMQPGLQDGDRLIVIKPVYTFTSPQRGEIVIIHPPVAPDKEWVKRVIGIPGDTVEIKNGMVYVNNVALDEPYIKAKPAYPRYGPIKVPPDNYFVLGDNRNNSTDSHTGWTVSRQNVVGEVWLRIWPFSNWGIVRGYPLSQELQSSAQNQTSLLTGSLIWP